MKIKRHTLRKLVTDAYEFGWLNAENHHDVQNPTGAARNGSSFTTYGDIVRRSEQYVDEVLATVIR